MIDTWRLEKYGLLRIAGLPADALDDLRLSRSGASADQVELATEAASVARQPIIDSLFEMIHGCQDRTLRRYLMELKRSVHNARPIGGLLSREIANELSVELLKRLSNLADAEAALDAHEREYQNTFAAEWQHARQALYRVLDNDRFLNGLLLSSRELCAFARKLADSPDISIANTTTRRQKWEATLARYVVRAALRTTPFSSFAAVALTEFGVGVREAEKIDGAAVPPCELTVRWRSAPQLDSSLMDSWLANRLSQLARHRLPVRAAPLRLHTIESPPSVVFPHFTTARVEGELTARPLNQWVVLLSTAPIERIISLADTIPTDDLLDALVKIHSDRDDWSKLIEELVQAGLLERLLPRVDVTASGLDALTGTLEALGDARSAAKTRRFAQTLRDYSVASHCERVKLVSELETELGTKNRFAPLYEDVMLEGVAPDDPPIDRKSLKDDLLPALILARANITNVHHRVLCDAFVQRFGSNSLCRDVPSFLVELLRDDDFMSRMRALQERVGWLDSRLGLAVQSADGESMDFGLDMFSELEAPSNSGSLAVFFQIDALDRHALERGDYRVVLNGVQSGRGKYLSRYLGNNCVLGETVLAHTRKQLAETEGPLPVEISPALGLNFQLHPPMTEWALELPFEAAMPASRVIPLSELTLRFNSAASVLHLHSTRLDRDIEPVHFGFLRDLALPDALLLLRALSPRFGEDAVAERVQVYNQLDGIDLFQKRPLRPFRPRLTVGRLVLERARWAVPTAEIPQRRARESFASFFRRIHQWRRSRGLPARCFARPISLTSYRQDIVKPRMYLDWYSPFTLTDLPRVVSSRVGEPLSNWLVMTELLPKPEEALQNIGGQSHASEHLLQFEWEPNIE